MTCCQLSRRLSVFLLVIFGGSAGSWGGHIVFVPSLSMPFVSMGLFHPAGNVCSLSRLKHDKIFKKYLFFFFSTSLVISWTN